MHSILLLDSRLISEWADVSRLGLLRQRSANLPNPSGTNEIQRHAELLGAPASLEHDGSGGLLRALV